MDVATRSPGGAREARGRMAGSPDSRLTLRAQSLLEVLQQVIERTYRMDTGIRDIHRFVVGDRGLAQIYGGARIVRQVGSRNHGEAKVLVREHGGTVRVNIYYPDRLIAALEAQNPLRGLDRDNLDLFAVFVEELDHFLLIADRARGSRQVSLFELELHANVTKYVAAAHFLARSLGRRLADGERRWLRWSLFEKLPLDPAASEVHQRYRDADRLGHRYCGFLDQLDPRSRLTELRAFHRRSCAASIRAMQRLAA